MIDVKLPLRTAYNTRLTGITYSGQPVPVYYQYLPDGEEPDNYIIFGSITDNDNSTMNSQDSIVNMQVKVHTWADKYNTGDACDQIAGQVLQLIYPGSGAQFDLRSSGIQVHSTKKTNDFTEDWTVQNNRVYIDRTLQFSHNIYYL